MKSLWLWQYWKTDENALVTSFVSIHKHPISSQWDFIFHHLRISVLEVGSFRGRQCITLLITLNKDLDRTSDHFNSSQRYSIQQLQYLQDLHRLIESGYDRQHFNSSQRYSIQQLQYLQDLHRLIESGYDRQLWEHLCNYIFEAAQADWSPNHEAGEHFYVFSRYRFQPYRSKKRTVFAKVNLTSDLL